MPIDCIGSLFSHRGRNLFIFWVFYLISINIFGLWNLLLDKIFLGDFLTNFSNAGDFFDELFPSKGVRESRVLQLSSKCVLALKKESCF